MRLRLLLGVMTFLAACGAEAGGIEISDARIGQPAGPNAAMYFTATNSGEADRLVGVSTEAADVVEVHETTTNDNGTMGMRRVDALDLSVNGTLVLEPGGSHLMLLGAGAMEVGDTVAITLIWEKAGEMTIEAEVTEPGDIMGSGDDG